MMIPFRYGSRGSFRHSATVENVDVRIRIVAFSGRSRKRLAASPSAAAGCGERDWRLQKSSDPRYWPNIHEIKPVSDTTRE